jgi:two-component sensor histidine kinase
MVLHIEKAIPVGLIANELIVNSLKHAIGEGGGDLRLSLRHLGRNDGSPRAMLSVEDSGPGFPAGLDTSETRSMGYRLVNLLVRQLRARRETGPGPGASVTIEFPITHQVAG